MASRLRPLMEAGTELGWSRQKMLRLANTGRIPAVKVSGLWYFVGSVEEWIRSLQEAGAEKRQAVDALRDSVRPGRHHMNRPATTGGSSLADLMPAKRRF